ncbi:hypothetical protein [Pseudomonas sp. Gutcm_11s]|uniref:hypothetical protein n=1 Tax=Pseudomonas sp. Gutcm_11s TaxID=3026088 RepID=UPI00236012D9|nr:hypothetical protein [Pseudomonas sp. Gutcm_11s]MDD0844470.1 hypothetical protein [Pseudomonas sp. Gutcm_11s]
MNCWNILGIRADADERTIKRSYAALLKVHRPDEDLDAFQRLREAYEQALGLARRRVEQDEAEDDIGLGDVLERAVVAPLDQDLRARIDASLGDLAPPTLEAAAIQARDQGQLALFECCLLGRCLTDNERGYAAAHWALTCLHWLTPWQEPSLPGDQLDALLNRLLATELHALHDLLAEGHEAGFQERLEALFGQAWLQPFERRSYFKRQLVDVLLAVPSWSEEFLRDVIGRCQWDDVLARQEGWLQEWDQLLHRLELRGLHERINSRLNLRKPDSPQARAAWLLFKPLSNGQRKRMVDSFTDKDWAGCQLLEETLQQDAPELLTELAPQGAQDWRRWMRSSQWEGTGVCLWLLLLGPMWLDLVARGGGLENAAVWPAVLAASTMSALLAGVLVMGHRAWSYCTSWLTRTDVLISMLLLPASLTRQGTGVLIIRHLLPCLAIAGVVSIIGTKGAKIDWLAGVLAGLVAFAYVDFNTKVGPSLVLLRAYLGSFKHWNKALVLAGLMLFAMAVFWSMQQRSTQVLGNLPERSVPSVSQQRATQSPPSQPERSVPSVSQQRATQSPPSQPERSVPRVSQQRGTQSPPSQPQRSVPRFSGNQGPFELTVPKTVSCNSTQYGGCDFSGESNK